MAIYASMCHECGTEHEYVAKIANDEYKTAMPMCCGKQTDRMVTAAALHGIWTGHKGFIAHSDDGTPTFIESESDRKKFMKANNYLPADEAHAHADSSKERIKQDRKKRTRKYLEDRVAQLPTN